MFEVLNLFCEHSHFFLSPFDNPYKLHKIFSSNPEFIELNSELSQLFHGEDKRVYEGVRRCKGKYFCALKGVDYVETRNVKPTGIEAGNFGELSTFFENHPKIRDYFDTHLDQIKEYAKLFDQPVSTSGTLTVRLMGSKETIKINLKRKRDSSVVSCDPISGL